MKTKVITALLICLMICGCESLNLKNDDVSDGWISLFNGESLGGWKASEKTDTFFVKDGKIVADGGRSHLYYVGSVKNANFKNFEFKADVMTTPGSNSGIYFHTKYQQDDWPNTGYESQINSTHTDTIKCGSLYGLVNVTEARSVDNKWYNHHVIVKDKRVIVKIDGVTVVDYTEPPAKQQRNPERGLSSGTFALQGHDPNSVIYYKNIMVKPLP